MKKVACIIFEIIIDHLIKVVRLIITPIMHEQA